MSEPTGPAGHAAKLPLHALPWLPRSLANMRDQTSALPADPLAALKAAQALAQAGWAEADLRLLGRKVRSILNQHPRLSPPRRGGRAWFRSTF